jgi:nitroreductase
MAHSLMLLLHARGYGSIWRTGRLARSAAAGALLGLRDGEQLLGSLDIGTPDPAQAQAQRRRPLADVSGHITRFSGSPTGGLSYSTVASSPWSPACR